MQSIFTNIVYTYLYCIYNIDIIYKYTNILYYMPLYIQILYIILCYIQY
jgi:hypothetical protein